MRGLAYSLRLIEQLFNCFQLKHTLELREDNDNLTLINFVNQSKAAYYQDKLQFLL